MPARSSNQSDGKTTYEEGRDYEPVADAKLGQVPWGGEYEFDHPGAVIKHHAAVEDPQPANGCG